MVITITEKLPTLFPGQEAGSPCVCWARLKESTRQGLLSFMAKIVRKLLHSELFMIVGLLHCYPAIMLSASEFIALEE